MGVVIPSPASGSKLRGTAVVDAIFDGQNFDIAAVTIDGQQLASDTVQPISFSIDTTRVADGAHTLTVAVRYAVGRKMRWQKASIPVEIDNAPLPPIWSADHETGDLSQWDNVYDSDGGSSAVSTEQAHSGIYSARQDIDVDGTAGSRLRAFGSSGVPVDDAYYSVWLYLPYPSVTVPATFNFFQFKSKTLINGIENQGVAWAVYLQNRADGSLFWRLSDKTGRFDPNRPDQINYTDSPLVIPMQQWTHLEMRYKIALDFTGTVEVWQDDTLIYDKQNVMTAFPLDTSPTGYRVDWYINAYGTDITPRPYHHYIDDAAVRVGP